MKLTRRYTQPGIDPLDQIAYEKRRSMITNTDGSVVFEAKDIEVPRAWSQLATDIVVSKYFRRAGVPGETGRETSVRQVIHRIVHSIRTHGEEHGYFDGPADAETFEAELSHILATRSAPSTRPSGSIAACGTSTAWSPAAATTPGISTPRKSARSTNNYTGRNARPASSSPAKTT